jgi:pimeloyl-ACP methyl ester carboxylesterase
LKITAQDLQRHYASLADEELLLLNRDDLTDLARPCYETELERRGLNAAEPPKEAEPVAVATFANVNSAALARSVLKAAGIPCYLENEHAALMVPAGVLNEARRLLEEEEHTAEQAEPWDGNIAHQFVETNGIRMHYAEAGSGPLAILCHGFPESWNSWRHQLRALASEGYHAVAPDLRGYGQTDRPEAVEAYDIFQLTGDLVGLINGLGEGPAMVVGHDWGAVLAWHAALLRPDLVSAVALMSVPYVPRRAMNQTQWEAQKYPGKIFYQAVLRSPRAEPFFEADIRARLLAGLWGLSGDAPPDKRWQPARDQDAPPVPTAMPAGLPSWLADEDLDFLVGEYQRTGFTGGLNYYRNCDRNWELTPFLDGAQLPQRTLFVAGEKDPVLDFLGDEFAALESNVPYLWKKALIPGAGHWIQQERPDEVNRLLIGFFNELETTTSQFATAATE